MLYFFQCSYVDFKLAFTWSLEKKQYIYHKLQVDFMLYHLQIIKNTGASMKWIHAVLLLVYIRSWDHHTTSPSSLLHYQLQWFIVCIGVSTSSKTQPSLFLPSPSPLNLQTVQAPLLRQAPYINFFCEPLP